MAMVTGIRYLEKLVKFVEEQAGPLIEGSLVLKLNPAGLHYVQSRLEALHELERLLAVTPIDYLRAYVSDLGDHRALEQLRRILRLLTSLKVVSVLPPSARDPTPLSFLPFGRLKVLELRGCNLSTSAAKGLLELRHTLERIICHNSTDALRHVFACRMMEIKDCLQWNRLSFVSCACNGLVLMDESLQLLPAVQTLDLSRNKFAKVDNLHKCPNLKHLDLGFNHLRTIVPFSKVSCHIVRLVLRNNALTTLHGIENLKSLEGLDVSYNIISNLSELEFLSGLAHLRSLWLEGNPLCCARWYRAQVFSFFTYPEKLKLDGKEISTRDFWKRNIIIASKHKQPASFGFYLSAKETVGEGGINRMRKTSRLACIQSGEEIASTCSDLDSASCGSEVPFRDDSRLSDDEAEILGLIDRVENMKKERSILWLREFKDWMDISLDNARVPSPTNLGGADQDLLKPYSLEGITIALSHARNSHSDTLAIQRACKVAKNVNLLPLTNINDISGSGSSSVCPLSPPHYQEDLLHRQQSLVEEILHLSEDSFSVGSSDSNANCSDVDLSEFDPSVLEIDSFSDKIYVNGSVNEHRSLDLLRDKFCNQNHGISHAGVNGMYLFNSSGDQTSIQCYNDFVAGADKGKSASFVNQEADNLDIRKSKRNAKKRVISISEECSDSNACYRESEIKQRQISANANLKGKLDVDDVSEFSDANCCTQEKDDFIVTYFNMKIADSEAHEICTHCIRCNYVLQRDLISREREVAILLSSHKKLYVLLINIDADGSETPLSLLSCHKEEDVCELGVGMGLQAVRVNFDSGETHLFMTRSIEKSRELLWILQVSDACGVNGRCLIRSLEQIQVELFDNQICGGSKLSIYQYAMVLVCCNNSKEESWLSRSLFVIGGYVLLCIEDTMLFGSFSSDSSLPPYFRIDSCCSITDITEVVIEAGESHCVTLVLKQLMSEFHPSAEANPEAVNHKVIASVPCKLKLRWFSKDNLLKFVSLLKTLHAKKLVARWIS